MIISKKSTHARLYAIMYGEYSLKKVTNLCPYFWKLIWSAICLPLFLILRLIGLPLSLLISRVWPDAVLDIKQFDEEGYFSEKGFIVVLIAVISFGLFSMIYVFFDTHPVPFISVSAAVGFALLLTAIIVHIWSKLNERTSEKKEPKPSIIKEFIKAKYNKYCPKIDWKD